MKKVLIAVFCYSFFTISCDDTTKTSLKTGDSTATKKNYTPAFGRQIPKDSAELMINKFKDRKQHLKFDGIVWAYFDTASMRALYSDSTIKRVIFFIGVDDSNNSSKKDMPVIILQVLRNDKDTNTPLPVEYFEGNTLCPPPHNVPCGTPTDPSNS